jgi:hypothetical protein
LQKRHVSMPCKTTAIAHHGRLAAVVIAIVASALGLSHRAEAQPIRLRADALAQTQGSSSPAGLLVLQGEDPMASWVSAEGLVWGGTTPLTGDVLVLAVRLREPHGYAEARVGRFVLATGAVHPVQIDGAHALARAPWGSMVETFGGMPVVPRFGSRSYDWLAGGRIAQTVVGTATLGVSYVQRRQDGDLAGNEVGADVAVAAVRWLDLAAFGAYDLTSPGLAEARASVAVRFLDWRFELFGSQMSPGRLLPATSLFSVLGDVPSETLGATVRWRAAPRLDVLASGAGQDVAGGAGGNAWIRSTLRLDDRGLGSLGLEVRRVDLPQTEWTGVRAIATLPLGHGLRYATELEIVAPDHPDGRGTAWPWGLTALTWRAADGWEIAGALEASSTPLHRYEADALLRLSMALGSASREGVGQSQVSR